MVELTLFGFVRDARWQPERHISERVERDAAYIQYIAVRAIRDTYNAQPVEELAEQSPRLGTATPSTKCACAASTLRRAHHLGTRAQQPSLLPRPSSISDLLLPVGHP